MAAPALSHPSATSPELRQTPPDSAPGLTFLFEARVDLDPTTLDLGTTPAGHREIFLVLGGSLDGPVARGIVVPGSGADWVTTTPDGTLRLDVRLSVRTDDGALLYLRWRGRFWAPPGARERALDLGKPDDLQSANEFYFRAAVEIETAAPRYAWLNQVVVIARSRLGAGAAFHRFFAVN